MRLFHSGTSVNFSSQNIKYNMLITFDRELIEFDWNSCS